MSAGARGDEGGGPVGVVVAEVGEDGGGASAVCVEGALLLGAGVEGDEVGVGGGAHGGEGGGAVGAQGAVKDAKG